MDTQKNGLTAQDYADIQQLNARYARSIDFNERAGAAWAELFVPDGALIAATHEVRGRDALREFANTAYDQGGGATRHLISNVVVTPTPEGAMSREYVSVLRVGNPPTVIATGQYEDVLVKTADGWRIKQRIAKAD